LIQLLILARALATQIYTESISLQSLGAIRISRASHVESDGAGNWWADLSPSHGPVLGPFPQCSLAMHAEHDWLVQHVILAHESNQKVSSQNHELATPIERTTNSIPSESQSIKAGLSGPDLS
jgi:hypothetical protein